RECHGKYNFYIVTSFHRGKRGRRSEVEITRTDVRDLLAEEIRRLAMDHRAWVAKAPKQPLVLEAVDLGLIGPEEVEVAVEHCGVCHSDLSVLNNDWGISQYPAILDHEVVGRVTAMGPT